MDAGAPPVGRLGGAGWRTDLDEAFGEPDAAPAAEQRATISEAECAGCGHRFLAVNGRTRCICCRCGQEAVREGSEDDEPEEAPRPVSTPAPRPKTQRRERRGPPTHRRRPREGDPVPTNVPLVKDPEALRLDIVSGMSLEGVAEKWGVTTQQVRKYCSNHHLTVPPTRKEIDEIEGGHKIPTERQSWAGSEPDADPCPAPTAAGDPAGGAPPAATDRLNLDSWTHLPGGYPPPAPCIVDLTTVREGVSRKIDEKKAEIDDLLRARDAIDLVRELSAMVSGAEQTVR